MAQLLFRLSSKNHICYCGHRWGPILGLGKPSRRKGAHEEPQKKVSDAIQPNRMAAVRGRGGWESTVGEFLDFGGCRAGLWL